MKKIGVFGGTFDPIHFGHLLIAQSVLEKLDLDQILFVPAGYNPFKTSKSEEERKLSYHMVKEAIKDNPKFEVTDIELMREGKSYTFDTISSLKQQEDADYYFLIGSDLLDNLDDWYKIEDLLSLVTLVVVGRPKADKDILKKIRKNIDKFGANIIFCSTDQMDISSTTLRNRVFMNKPIDYYTPKSTIEFIEDKNLYAFDDEFQELIENLKESLKKTLKPKRYQHTLGVVETAKKLAELYQADLKKAIIAALLHDCAKAMSIEEMEALAQEENYLIPEEVREAPKTLHAPIGALLAKKEYGIDDEEILSAIAKHTTGSENMSKLDKVIFLADAIEPNRDYDGVEELRELAKVDLDQAIIAYLDHTISYLKETDQPIDSKIYKVRDKLLE